MCELSTSGTVAPTVVTTTTTTTTTTAPTTVPLIAPCPAGINICYNGGACLILNGRDFICSCPSGFSGKFIYWIY